ncbi:MAG: GNAT family N-acetyltransferase [Bacteroidota bacterium]
MEKLPKTDTVLAPACKTGTGIESCLMAMSSPVIYTSRLRLRPLSLTDASFIQTLRNDPAVNTYIRRDMLIDRKTAEAFIQKILNGEQSGTFKFWAISLPAEQLIGTICLWNFNPERTQAEVGYELLPLHQKKGYMQESLRAVMDFGFNELKLGHIDAYTHFENQASLVLLGREGFDLMPDLKDPDIPENRVFRKKNPGSLGI